jgi:hypothetical protein
MHNLAPSAAVRKSPPQAAKARSNNALIHGHGASASAPRCHDVASVAVASVATDARNAAGLAAAHAVSVAALALAAAAGSITLPVCSVNLSWKCRRFRCRPQLVLTTWFRVFPTPWPDTADVSATSCDVGFYFSVSYVVSLPNCQHVVVVTTMYYTHPV